MNIIFREYDPSTGKIIGASKSMDFGRSRGVKVYDAFVVGATVQSMELTLKSSGSIPMPKYVGGAVTAASGSFGIEVSDTLSEKGTLSTFFSSVGASVPITVTNGISQYIYLSVNSGEAAAGSFQYAMKVYHSGFQVSSSSSSQSLSSSSSNPISSSNSISSSSNSISSSSNSISSSSSSISSSSISSSSSSSSCSSSSSYSNSISSHSSSSYSNSSSSYSNSSSSCSTSGCAISIISTEYKLTASDAQDADWYGKSVAIKDGQAIVGADGEDGAGSQRGAAYIYAKSGVTWNETKIIASDTQDNDQFGEFVAIDKDIAVVGAYRKNSNIGAAYIYKWNGASWVETKITASDGLANDFFGYSVSVSGDRVLVGAYGVGPSRGAAYLYDWNGASWVETKITASDIADGDLFGSSVSIYGDRMAIGASNENSHGSIYVYDWNGASWVETKITPSDAQTGDQIGYSICVNRDQVIVGSYNDAESPYFQNGAAYIYKWNGALWGETKIFATDIQVGGSFGQTVSIHGNYAVVGAFNNGEGQRGAAYIYEWDGISWNGVKAIPSDLADADAFAYSVSMDGNRFIAGAWAKNSQRGAAYIYDYSPCSSSSSSSS